MAAACGFLVDTRALPNWDAYATYAAMVEAPTLVAAVEKLNPTKYSPWLKAKLTGTLTGRIAPAVNCVLPAEFQTINNFIGSTR